MVYNPVGSEIHRIAKNARKEFNDKFNKKMADFDKKIAEDRQNMDACTICGEVKLEFAPPVLYCSGTCARAIKRGSCIKPSEPIPLPDCTITKAELESNRKQHSEVHPKSWGECDGGCGRWPKKRPGSAIRVSDLRQGEESYGTEQRKYCYASHE
eukprot:gene20658-25270_t